MIDKIKGLLWTVLGIIMITAFVFLFVLVLRGGISLAITILPWMNLIAGLILLLNILIFFPLSFIKKTRGSSAIVFYISSYIYGLDLWLRSLLLTYYFWGGFWVVIGLLFAGAGVLPMALLATMFDGSWLFFFGLCLDIVIIWGFRLYALNLAKKEDELNDGIRNNVNSTPTIITETHSENLTN